MSLLSSSNSRTEGGGTDVTKEPESRPLQAPSLSSSTPSAVGPLDQRSNRREPPPNPKVDNGLDLDAGPTLEIMMADYPSLNVTKKLQASSEPFPNHAGRTTVYPGSIQREKARLLHDLVCG